MLVKCDVDSEFGDISCSVTLLPRLKYSMTLLDDIIDVLAYKQTGLKNANKIFITDFDESNTTHLDALKLESLTIFSLDTLLQIKHSMSQISNLSSIPTILPSLIPMLRITSAQLFDAIPHCSRKLSELAVHLGSIVLDSATLTTARFDFSQSNIQSAALLDKVKLMTHSKLNKQYPNLDFVKLCNT